MTSNLNLSPKQNNIFNYIVEYFEENGISPTIEDVKKGCKISSKSVVSYNLNILENKGLIDRKKGIARSITRAGHQTLQNSKTLTSGFEDYLNIPIVTSISAGSPLELLTSEEIMQNYKSGSEFIEIPSSLYSKKSELIGVRIKGDSMSGDSIEDGDIIIIDCSKNSNASPKQGEMVVARVNEDTATLKRFYKKGNKIELHPSNKKYSALIEDAKNVIIEGKVVALIRKF